MSIIKPLAGTFSGLYVGNSTATSTPLTQINAFGTKGYEVSYILPQEEFCFATGQYEQTGTYKIALKLAFESDELQAYNLAMGNSISATLNTKPSNTIYTVFLVDAVNFNSSILLPKVQTVVNPVFNRQKNAPFTLDIVLRFEGPDATFSPTINSMSEWLYYGSISALSSKMGGMTPL